MVASGARGTRNGFSLFEVMMKDLNTAVGVLMEELKEKDDPGKCCGEREPWRKVQLMHDPQASEVQYDDLLLGT